VGDSQFELKEKQMSINQPSLLDVVALLHDFEAEGLVRGQVGAVVELLGDDNALVEFANANGETFAMPTLPLRALLRLEFEPIAI
jgi:hypothetical protein